MWADNYELKIKKYSPRILKEKIIVRVVITKLLHQPWKNKDVGAMLRAYDFECIIHIILNNKIMCIQF